MPIPNGRNFSSPVRTHRSRFTEKKLPSPVNTPNVDPFSSVAANPPSQYFHSVAKKDSSTLLKPLSGGIFRHKDGDSKPLQTNLDESYSLRPPIGGTAWGHNPVPNQSRRSKQGVSCLLPKPPSGGLSRKDSSQSLPLWGRQLDVNR